MKTLGMILGFFFVVSAQARMDVEKQAKLKACFENLGLKEDIVCALPVDPGPRGHEKLEPFSISLKDQKTVGRFGFKDLAIYDSVGEKDFAVLRIKNKMIFGLNMRTLRFDCKDRKIMASPVTLEYDVKRDGGIFSGTSSVTCESSED